MTTPIVLPDSDNLKRCTLCGEAKELALFSRDKRRADGRRAWCKSCQSARARSYYETHAEQRREYARTYNAEHNEQRSEYRRAHHAANRKRNNARSLAYYAAHIEEIREYQREYRAANAERRNEYGRLYRAANPEVMRKHERNRRARKAGNGGTYTTEDLALIRKSQTDSKGRLICWRCGKPITDTPDLDHWIPLKHDGLNSAGNLHYMHAHCNRTKHAKHPFELGRLL